MLTQANLAETDLSGANLRRAKLSGANLYKADLRRADLSGAKLGEANKEILTQHHSSSFEGATMPNGQKYEDWFKEKGSGK
jgi:uncharacterized protein YjbI with pentapeptide repeats